MKKIFIIYVVRCWRHCVVMFGVLGHRFRPMYDFGFVALDILYTFPEDTGIYLCKATNKYGSDVNQVTLRCLGMLRTTTVSYFTVALVGLYSVSLSLRLEWYSVSYKCTSAVMREHSCDSGISLLNYCHSWDKFVNTHLS